MYINNEEREAKIGKVSVSVSRGNSIKLRFTYPKGKRHDMNVSTNTDEGWINALRIAQAINADIELGQFDDTLAKYSSRRSQALELASRELYLLEYIKLGKRCHLNKKVNKIACISKFKL